MRLATCCIVAMLVLGCEERSDTPQVDSAPPRQAGAAPPTTTPARPPVVLVVDEQPLEFPPARLLVEARNGRTVVLIMSDDPRDAINDDYTGNGYHLELVFDEELASLRDCVWQSQPTSAAPTTYSPHGIFLEGNRRQLVPFEVKVHFEHREGEPGVAWISGTFHVIEEPPPGGRRPPPRLVPVAGRIPVTIP